MSTNEAIINLFKMLSEAEAKVLQAEGSKDHARALKHLDRVTKALQKALLPSNMEA